QALREGNGGIEVVDPDVEMQADLADLRLGNGLEVDHRSPGAEGSEAEPSVRLGLQRPVEQAGPEAGDGLGLAAVDGDLTPRGPQRRHTRRHYEGRPGLAYGTGVRTLVCGCTSRSPRTSGGPCSWPSCSSWSGSASGPSSAGSRRPCPPRRTAPPTTRAP